MNDNDILRLVIIYDTGSTAYSAECVVTRTVWELLKEQVDDVSLTSVIFKGKLNDIDGNAVEYKIDRESIKSMNAVTVNGME